MIAWLGVNKVVEIILSTMGVEERQKQGKIDREWKHSGVRGNHISYFSGKK